MSAAEILRALEAAGVSFEPVAEGWAIHGTPAALAGFALAERSQLRAELVWRRVAVRRAVPASGGIPVLVARDAPGGPGLCASCGEATGEFRCRLCQVAAAAAIADGKPAPQAEEPAKQRTRQ